MSGPDIHVDVVVVGAGQAGLAAGYWLTCAGTRFLIVDGADRVGDSWRERYDSLTLFTPRRFSALPSLSLTGDPEGYPGRLEFADYLERYAAMFSLPVAMNRRVMSVTAHLRGFRVAFEDGDALNCRSVIVASGGFQLPIWPQLSQSFDHTVAQFDAESYRNPGAMPSGPVLVVGDGASGRDIALELAATNQTWLAVGKPRKLFPERFLGQSIWHWLSVSGLLRVGPGGWLGRRMRRIDPFPDRGRSLGLLAASGVTIAPRLMSSKGARATFEDGRELGVSSVIWCVGYRDDYDWLDVAGAKDASGNVVHVEGVSPVKDLYFIGRPWQRNRASALVMGAREDARIIVERATSVWRRQSQPA